MGTTGAWARPREQGLAEGAVGRLREQHSHRDRVWGDSEMTVRLRVKVGCWVLGWGAGFILRVYPGHGGEELIPRPSHRTDLLEKTTLAGG